MGWTGLNKPKGISIIDFIEEDVFQGDSKWEVIYKCSIKKSLFFAIKNKETLAVTASIVIYDFKSNTKDYYNLSYKIMCEGAMPYYFCNNAKFLKLLTPTENKYSLEWRAHCQEEINKKKEISKIKSNDIVKLNDDTNYNINGTEINYLKVINLKRNIALPMIKDDKNNYVAYGTSTYNFTGFNRRIEKLVS